MGKVLDDTNFAVQPQGGTPTASKAKVISVVEESAPTEALTASYHRGYGIVE
jgi:hypothetical protein